MKKLLVISAVIVLVAYTIAQVFSLKELDSIQLAGDDE